MSTIPSTLRADQLIYSNVEAEFSPVSRRGFQVWLCSPRLKEVQREIARRVEDFTWPAADAAAGKLTERLAYFRIPSDEFVLARTVPLKERDALRRGGRFHAHAVVLAPDEFRRLGSDPFAVFDRFHFHDSPISLIESGAWKNGTLPDQDELSLDRDPPAVVEPFELTKLLPLIVRWLDGPDDPRPAAMADHPDRVAAWLRSVFRRLPPTLRERASFDTLSSGQVLATLPYRFIGGYDSTTIRDWPYRRAYRIDLSAGMPSIPPTPAENTALEQLAKEWLSDKPWSDHDLETTYQLHQAIVDPRRLPVDPTGASVSKVNVTLAEPGAAEAWPRWIEHRLTIDVPQDSLRHIVQSYARKWLGLSPDASHLVRISQPIPLEKRAAWLYEASTNGSISSKTAADLDSWTREQLEAGATDPTIGKLRLIALAHSGKADSIRHLAAIDGGWRSLVDDWFVPWFTKHSATAHLGADPIVYAAAVIADTLPDRGPAEFDIWASLQLGHHDSRVATAIAFRNGDRDKLADLLRANSVLQWAVGLLVDRPDAAFAYEWGQPPFDDCPGAYLQVPFRAAAVPGAEALYSALERLSVGGLMVRTRAQDFARRCLPQSQSTTDLLYAADRYYQSRKWEKLERELAAIADPSDFRRFLVDRLHDKARLADGPVPCQRWQLPTGEPVLWVGWRIVSNGNYADVFDGLYGAVMSVIRSDPALSHGRIAALVSAVTSLTR